MKQAIMKGKIATLSVEVQQSSDNMQTCQGKNKQTKTLNNKT